MVAAFLGAGAPACSRSAPPAPPGSPWIAAPDDTGRLAAPSALPDAKADAADASPIDSDLLPQTPDKPTPFSAALDARMALLWAAIVSDDPDAATPAFFPLGAYQQVKDVADPAADWKRRLVAAYRRDIHTLHASLGDEAGAAKLVSYEVPDGRARWVDPGEEWNKLGYYRVFGTKFHYDLDGTARWFEVKSMISWRGEWYVVHLSAIR